MWKPMKQIIKFFQPKNQNESLRETIEELIEDNSQGQGSDIEADERLLLGNVLNLRDLVVKDIMVPRVDIKALAMTYAPQEILDYMVTQRLSNVPMYMGSLDQIVGSVNVKDLLQWLATAQERPQFRSLLRDVLFVSPTMRTLDLLLEMRQSGIKYAMVVDEYGGIDGLVSFNDLVEEIVGDIQEAQEPTDAPKIEVRPDQCVVVDSRVALEDLIPYFSSSNTIANPLKELVMKEIDTIGGLVVAIAGHVPVRGEVIKTTNHLEFEILYADPRRIHRLCIRDGRVKK
jgi:magnesium and cobalt transporter